MFGTGTVVEWKGDHWSGDNPLEDAQFGSREMHTIDTERCPSKVGRVVIDGKVYFIPVYGAENDIGWVILEEMVEFEARRLQPASYPVMSALTWRIVSDIVRFSSRKLDPRVAQYYPGSSGHGVVCVWAGDENTTIYFGLGGGQTGSIRLRGPIEGEPVGNVHELLEGVSAPDLVGRILLTACWPKPWKAKTTPHILGIRTIARFLERYMVAPRPFRTTMGWEDDASCWPQPAGWVELVPEVWREAKRADLELEEKFALGRDLWLLHRCDESADPMWSADDAAKEPAVILNLRTGQAIPTQKPDRPWDLMRLYRESGHELRAVLRWVEDAVEAP